jgi:outer membrane immunogenic protein
MALNTIACLLAAASAVAAFTAPAQAQAQAQEPVRRAFEGPRVEALGGTDGRLFYGGAIGYDLQRGNAVFGIEGELDLSSRNRCQTPDVLISDRLCERSRRDTYIGGRIGGAVAPATLLYAKVGYTHLRSRYAYDAGPGGGSSLSFTRGLDGIRAGVGIEQKVGTKLYVKGEYRYSDYQFGGWKHDGVLGIGFRF